MEDRVHQDLGVVASVPRHGRLGSNRSGLFVEKMSFLLPLKRYAYGDSRRQLVIDLQNLVDHVALLKKNEFTAFAVNEALAGLRRLRETTYSQDAVMRSQLEIYCRKLEAAV